MLWAQTSVRPGAALAPAAAHHQGVRSETLAFHFFILDQTILRLIQRTLQMYILLKQVQSGVLFQKVQ